MKLEDIVKKYKTIQKVSEAVKGLKGIYVGNNTVLNSGSGLQHGSEITILNCSGSMNPPYHGYYLVSTSIGNRNVYGCELKMGEPTVESIEEDIKALEKSIVEDQEEVKKLKSKIQFMKENKLETYDENVFKAYHTLTILGEASDTMSKAKAIAELFKQ